MDQANSRPRLGVSVIILLLLAGIAVVGLLLPWFLEDVNGKRFIQWKQGVRVMLVAVVSLSVLLVLATRRRAPVHALCLVFGLLAGLCIVIDAAFVLAVFDYAVSGDLAVALRIVPVVYLFAAVAAALGCAAGFVVGMGLSFLRQRTRNSIEVAAEGGTSPTKRRPSLRELAGGAILVALAIALYFPISNEFRRRHAVLSLRAQGDRVDMMGRLGPGGESPASIEEALDWLQRGALTWHGEGVLYSLEPVRSIRVRGAVDDATVCAISCLPEVQGLILNAAQLTDEGWERLLRLPSLAHLHADSSNIADDHLRHLAGSASLRYLGLSHTQVSDEGLRHLSGLPLLLHLHLRHTSITDAGLEHLGGLPSLRSLSLGNTRVKGAGLRHLARIQGLVGLGLEGTELTESGLARLNRLPQLASLSFHGARFSESAFQDLGQLSQVQQLFLDDTNVSDAWLQHLTAMKNPRLQVFLVRTQVTPEGIRALQNSLRGGKVYPPPERVGASGASPERSAPKTVKE